MECLKQFLGIISGYEINILLDHKNLVHDATLSEYQRVMHWQLILKEFGPNIQHISLVDNIVANMLRIFLSTPSDKYEPCKRKDRCRANKLFALFRIENNEYCVQLNILIVQREQQKELRNINSKINT